MRWITKFVSLLQSGSRAPCMAPPRVDRSPTDLQGARPHRTPRDSAPRSSGGSRGADHEAPVRPANDHGREGRRADSLHRSRAVDISSQGRLRENGPTGEPPRETLISSPGEGHAMTRRATHSFDEVLAKTSTKWEWFPEGFQVEVHYEGVEANREQVKIK